MSRQIQFRRGTADEHKNFTGAEGEITVDLTNKTLRVHDGTTPGGTMLARADAVFNLMPDYARSSAITGTGTYTANENLFLQGYIKLIWNATASIKILDADDQIVMTYMFQDDDLNTTRYMSFSIPVPCGYKYQLQYGGNSTIIGKIVPCIK